MHRSRGFTLIELMVTVVIVGILAAIAYPAYGSYLVKGDRSAAQAHMMELAQAQAQYLADNRGYASSVAALNMTTPAAVSSKYVISVVASDGPPPSFTIKATPIAGTRQAADGELEITSTGARTPAAKW
jgi:type IV pilus assembly protein PilE